MEEEVKKEYTKEDITVVWKPKKCIHAEECVKSLPQVYKPKEKPWISVENASSEELINQIKKCPSGALSYYFNKETDKKSTNVTTIEIIENGPMVVQGNISITHKNGNVTKESKAALCRCGQSSNKPYCDGSHSKAGFEG